ncbi:MAG: hypothetical protein J7641_05865 [Cyanobacteria bacterium SID2]|nr:hypothetical protein [Cyanobacteria bacterium SID2]MBP0002887.1 hypothetical protein [Cyanobacteria bacterium SBC]
MLHLAQVTKKGLLGKTVLRLLARRRPDETWAVLSSEENVETDASNYGEGILVLVDVGANRQVQSVKEAKDWVLSVISEYLAAGITPEFLQKEAERAEQWRQSLTLQSQDLARRTVELETRREQIQALEEKLKREKRLLQSMAAQLKAKARQG